jgi:predicted Zn finger-like uncharacterized protein
MRLICPNCGAQYEVPDDVVPEGGRDVQCSNCGDTWFQKHPSQDRELSEELEQPLDEVHWEDDQSNEADDEAEYAPDSGSGETSEMSQVPEDEEDEGTEWEGFEQSDPEPEPEYDPEPEDAADAEHEPETEYAAAPEPEYEPEPDDAAKPEADLQPRELDPRTAEILREEAEREQQARAAESAGGLETQPDLGLSEPDDDENLQDREARLRMARMRGLSEEEALGAAAGLAANASRRDLLPDIEEINSSLRKDSDRFAAVDTEESAGPARPRRGGFSRGFLMMVLLGVILILLYVFAGKIIEMVPALQGVMEGYVSLVNGLRGWLDRQILALMGWLDGMTSQTPTDGS